MLIPTCPKCGSTIVYVFRSDFEVIRCQYCGHYDHLREYEDDDNGCYEGDRVGPEVWHTWNADPDNPPTLPYT